MEVIRSWPDVVPAENRTLGWAALGWTAQYLKQPDGPNAGDTWVYTREQVRIILRWYEIDDQGRFVHRRGAIRRIKGWGKDPFLASIAAVELCGPCRFGGWDPQGNPIAIAHPAPWIQVAATTYDQTRNTMTLFPSLFSKDAIKEYNIDLGKEIIYTRGKGRLEAVTSSPRSLEGGRPSFVILNETQHWLQGNQGLDMAAAIRRNLGKSRDGSARAMEITNAHLPGEGSVAEMTYEAWRQSEGKQQGVYYDSTEAPFFDLRDTVQLREALIAVRGDSTWLNVDRVLDEVTDPINSESVSRRFYLDQIFGLGEEEWLPKGAWAGIAKPEITIPDTTQVVLAVDGSYSDDSTAVIVASISSTPHIDVVHCWEKPDSKADWTVPILEVEDVIREACKKWRVKEVLFDPYRWARTMQVLQREGLPIIEYPQSQERMIPATQRFFEAVVNNQMTHSGNEILARHVANCVVQEDSRGRRIKKDKKWSLRKIDCAVAAVMAHSRAALQRSSAAREWLESLASPCVVCGSHLDQPGDKCTKCSPPPGSPQDFSYSPPPSATLPTYDHTRASMEILKTFGARR